MHIRLKRTRNLHQRIPFNMRQADKSPRTTPIGNLEVRREIDVWRHKRFRHEPPFLVRVVFPSGTGVKEVYKGVTALFEDGFVGRVFEEVGVVWAFGEHVFQLLSSKIEESGSDLHFFALVHWVEEAGVFVEVV